MKPVTHPLAPSDAAAMRAMREAIGPTKPRFGPDFRVPFDDLMEHTPDAPGVAYEEGNMGGVPGWWCRPENPEDGAAIFYLHGGAFIVGSARADRHLAGQIASRAGVAAFVAEYRLAPENPFPAAVEDGAAAYRGLVAAGFGRIATVGDSAGGGLALGILARMAAEGSPPVGAVVLSPWVDLAMTGGSLKSRADADPLLSGETLGEAAGRFLVGHDPRDPQASPLYGDLRGLPPVAIHVGEDEVLLDDARRYAERTIASGGRCELHVWEGMTHVFPSAVGQLAAAGQALDLIGAFLRARFHEENSRP